MPTIIALLSMFGITPERYPIAVLVAIMIGYVQFFIVSPLNKLKDNVLVVITHLSTSAGRKLDTSLIKQMSPLQIQPAGKEVLQNSGFIALFENESNKRKFLNSIQSKKPSTKFEVENYSTISYLEMFLDDGMMNPVKAYLYQHPEVRDTFPTLAGVYIRDVYLAEHPEIKQ